MKVRTYAFNSIIFIVKIALVIGLVISVTSLHYGDVSAAEEKYNMSYIYFGNTAAYIQQVKETQGAVSTVAPSYFDIKSDGSLDDKVDTEFIKAMKKQGVRVVPFLSNHWDRQLGRKALANREYLAKQIAEAVSKYDLDGVNVDIENVTAADRDQYTDLVRLLRTYLPEGKEVSVAVAANPNGWQTGWHGSYDYAALAKYSDYLMIMSYDESYQGSAPGPVASLAFVEKSIQYALSQKVPSEKIVLGIPFFARYWVNGQGGSGIGVNVVPTLVERYRGKTGYDQVSQSPYAVFNIGWQDETTRLNGQNLKPGSYTVWYEDHRSIEKKIELVHKYNLKGTGSWSLNQAPSDIWSDYMVWLNGKQGYADIANHWANQAVQKMIDRQWMVGVSKTQFAPDRALTRAEAAVVLVRSMGLQDVVVTEKELTTTFADTQDHWANREIAIASKVGLMSGVGEAKFQPNGYLTREQMASLFARTLSKSEQGPTEGTSELAATPVSTVSLMVSPVSVEHVSAEEKFADVSTERWSYPSIMTMANYQLLQGYEDGNFYPENYVTRAQLAVVLSRYLGV